MKRLLLLSNSTSPDAGFLGHALDAISDFLGSNGVEVLFVPYAAVIESYDEYTCKAGERFRSLGYTLISVHGKSDPIRAVNQAQAIVVGGGNTFHLLRCMHDAQIMQAIRKRVNLGVPYIGWSAGANVACPTIKTTNDMPVVWTPSADALNLVPFQINVHYTDSNPPGFHGETRARRIAEFTQLNPGVYVVGLPEGGMIKVEAGSVRLLGCETAMLFIAGTKPTAHRSLRVLEESLSLGTAATNPSPSS